MPHLVVEYTENVAGAIDPKGLILKLSDDVLASGQFHKDDIKARAIRHDVYAVGLNPDNGFIHVTLSLMHGRETEIRAALARSLMTTLRHSVAAGNVIPLTVEISEMERATYLKEMSSAGVDA